MFINYTDTNYTSHILPLVTYNTMRVGVAHYVVCHEYNTWFDA